MSIGDRPASDMTLDEIQAEVRVWADHNFPGHKPHEAALGIAEEAGEFWEALVDTLLAGKLSALVGRVCHAELKFEQGIRGTAEERRAKLEDAIGDTFVFLLHLCSSRGISAKDVLDRTWEQVRKRDWQKNRINGDADAQRT